MLALLTPLLFVAQLNTTDLLQLDFYQVANVHREAAPVKIVQQYRKFLNNAEAYAAYGHENRIRQTEIAFQTLGYDDSRALYELAGPNFLNVTGFQIMGYQSDVTLEAMRALIGEIPPDLASYGGMVTFPVQFDILDFMTGAEKQVTAIRYEAVRGGGFEEKLARFTVTLPAGAPEYHRIIGKGFGDTASGRGASDVIFVAYTKPDPVFKRRGADICVNVTVPLADLVASEEVEVENVNGERYKVSLSDWVRNGMQGEVRVEGKGLPRPLDPTLRGDFVVNLRVAFPEKVTDEQQKVIEEIL